MTIYFVAFGAFVLVGIFAMLFSSSEGSGRRDSGSGVAFDAENLHNGYHHFSGDSGGGGGGGGDGGGGGGE